MRLLLATTFAFLAAIGSAQADTRCVQEFLARTAFDPGPVDGLWGGQTAGALEAYFGQVGETVEGGVGRDNTEAVCGVLTGPRGPELLALGAYRIYEIAVDPAAMAGIVTERTAYDFSRHEVATSLYLACAFTFQRQVIQDGRRETLASGKLTVEAGRLFFGAHRWRTGGLADDTYLTEEANLAMTADGRVFGMTPFFGLYVDAGEVAMPPHYVTLSKSYESAGSPGNGLSHFDVDNWMDGLLSLNACRPID